MPPFGSRQLRPQCHCRHPPLWERTWRETNRVPGSWPMAHAGILGPAYEKTKHFLTSGYVYIYTKTHAYIYIYIYIYMYTYIWILCVCVWDTSKWGWWGSHDIDGDNDGTPNQQAKLSTEYIPCFKEMARIGPYQRCILIILNSQPQ